MMRLLELTTGDFASRKPQLCFWPVGTVEAHDLAPLGTDVLAPEILAADLAEEFGALILPTMPFGLVSSLAGYPGGMWMSRQTYCSAVGELLGSLRRSGVSSVVVFNGHGGNSSALSEVLPEVWKETGLRTAFIDWWTLCADISEEFFGTAGGHGGADEISLVKAALPGWDLPPWDGSRSCLSREGIRAWPSPRSSIRYSEGPATPLTEASAASFHLAARERISSAVREIVSGWELMQ